MKTLIISLLFILTANAQNIWYVNANNTSGPWNGRSWATAWRYLDSSSWAGPNGINWAIIQPGDTIYVSGGVDSLVYSNSNPNGFWIRPDIYRSFSNTVVITPAYHTGHNGKVIFETGSTNQQWLLRIIGVSNIKLRGFTFRKIHSGGTAMIQVGGGDLGDIDSLQTIEDCHIIGSGSTGMIYLSGSLITLRNNIIEQPENSSPAEQDPIGISSGRGGHTIDRNVIIYRNDNVGTDAHRDIIQWSNFGIESRNEIVTNIISNNLLIDTKAGGTSWTGLLYSSAPNTGVRWFIYNNVFVTAKNNTSVGGIIINHPVQRFNSIYILNNTFLMGGHQLQCPIVFSGNIDTIVVKNNLSVTDGNVGLMINNQALYPPGAYYRDFNFNGYFKFGGITGPFAAGDGFGNYTYEQWQARGMDLNSITGNGADVNFIQRYSELIENYFTNTGKNAGTNLSSQFPFLAHDALGNPRPANGPWDIGALQFQGTPSINFQGKIFLQGPSNGNLMKTYLADTCACIPLQQPYNTSPWNYAGNESIVFPNGQPGSGYIDWVLVELRSASNPVQVVGRRAAILRNDGRLLDIDGTPGVKFSNTNSGTYYVAVFHRNHLAVMSANPIQLSANSQLYDFTNSMNKAYGINPMADLGNGVFAMISGDGDSNGGVTITDRNGVWQAQNGTIGYKKGDFNLNGAVDNLDVNGFWTPNFGKMTQVP